METAAFKLTTVNAGNRLTDGSGNSYFYNNANQLLNFDAVTFEYDANGNTTSKTDSCGTSTYTWDSENRLTGINGFGAQCSPLSANFKYDPFGRRTEKNVNGAITKYVYDNEDIIAEYDGNNQLIASYTHGPGIDEPISMTNGQTYYYHTDALGSVIAITDSNRNVVQRYEYNSFGNIISMLDPNFIQPYTYTSREYDEETGLYYYRARYYDAKVGRFISEDPIRDGNNYFAYVVNNPLRYKDPKGMESCEDTLKGCCKHAAENDLVCLRSVLKGYTLCAMNCPIICLASGPAYPECVATCETGCAAGAAAAITYCHLLEVGEVAICYLNYYNCKNDDKKKCHK